MKEAAKAAETHDLKLLARAYAMNALASHFLSDRYASGHMRAPRVVMGTKVTPASVGNLLMKYMHDEDGDGLNVHNERGDHWRAYGDNYYFEAVADQHRKLLIEAMQTSVDEIDQVYQTGVLVTDSPLEKMIPIADEMGDNCHADVAVMFRYDAKSDTIYRRSDLSNHIRANGLRSGLAGRPRCNWRKSRGFRWGVRVHWLNPRCWCGAEKMG